MVHNSLRCLPHLQFRPFVIPLDWSKGFLAAKLHAMCFFKETSINIGAIRVDVWPTSHSILITVTKKCYHKFGLRAPSPDKIRPTDMTLFRSCLISPPRNFFIESLFALLFPVRRREGSFYHIFVASQITSKKLTFRSRNYHGVF